MQQESAERTSANQACGAAGCGPARNGARRRKLNCWEHSGCGREPGGARAHEAGVCAVFQAKNLTSVHGGLCAGRACWVVEGTLCGGEAQGSFSGKYARCSTCDFYLRVRQEEKTSFQLAATLLDLLHKPWAA